jgi:hypothetical protein
MALLRNPNAFDHLVLAEKGSFLDGNHFNSDRNRRPSVIPSGF